jgi:hypothetical protein
MDLKFQISIYNNASFNNFDLDNDEINYTQIDSTTHNFLNAPKIMDYENTIYYITLIQNFHPLGLFKYEHLEESKFSTLFYKQL